MKKLLFLLFACLISSMIHAQGSHLNFLGSPIDGTLEEYKEFLEKKDFRRDMSDKSYAGYFFNKFCTLNLRVNEDTKKVSSVEVYYYSKAHGHSQETLISLYNRIKQGLKNKYKKAKVLQQPGIAFFILPQGYIKCEIYEITMNFGNGTYLKVNYVDKLNTKNYTVPTLRNPENDL